MGMNRRQSERMARRVEVQFWLSAQAALQAAKVAAAGPVTPVAQKIQRGYSTNISTSGMHIATASPLAPQSRLRIEILFGRGFLVEGVVAHRRAVHPELAKVTPPGMGVRFMSPEELVGELFPQEAGAAGGRATGSGAEGEDAGAETRTFSVRFANPDEFLAVYDRDLLSGGLFVATSRPGRIRELVRLEIFPPGDGVPAVQVTARVVQRFLPEPGHSALAAGMGVELLDRLEAITRLQPIARRLGSRTA
jgi:hypothetical protein